MAESAEPEPGRPPKDELADEIEDLLEETDYWALTLGMIVERVDGSRRTVQDRLDDLLEDEKVEYQKIGNAKAYRGLEQRLSFVPALVTAILAGVVGYVAIAGRDIIMAWLASHPAVVFGVLLAVLTFIAVYPWVALARRTFSPGRGFTLDDLRAALMGVDR